MNGYIEHRQGVGDVGAFTGENHRIRHSRVAGKLPHLPPVAFSLCAAARADDHEPGLRDRAEHMRHGTDQDVVPFQTPPRPLWKHGSGRWRIEVRHLADDGRVERDPQLASNAVAVSGGRVVPALIDRVMDQRHLLRRDAMLKEKIAGVRARRDGDGVAESCAQFQGTQQRRFDGDRGNVPPK